MQEIIDRLTNEVARLRVELEFYKASNARKDRIVKGAKQFVDDVIEDELKRKEYWF